MTTMYDIGDKVLIPAKVEGIAVDNDGNIRYKVTFIDKGQAYQFLESVITDELSIAGEYA